MFTLKTKKSHKSNYCSDAIKKLPKEIFLTDKVKIYCRNFEKKTAFKKAVKFFLQFLQTKNQLLHKKALILALSATLECRGV